MLIAIEGLDYTGKSTLAKRLADSLSERYTVHSFRSPGGSEEANLTEELRSYCLTDTTTTLGRLMSASLSRHLVSEHIASLGSASENMCIVDRWVRSGYAYQVAGEGSDKDVFSYVNREVTEPDLEFLLTLSPHAYEDRKRAMNSNGEPMDTDPMEVALNGDDFLGRVKKGMYAFDGYRTTATVVIDTTDKSIDQVHKEMMRQVGVYLNF